MRSIEQPGPPPPERIQWVEARGRAFSFTLQAGLPLLEAGIPAACSNADYEAAMTAALAAASARWPGLRTVAFGDLFLEDIRAYRVERLARIGWEAITPLFGSDTATLAREVQVDLLPAEPQSAAPGTERDRAHAEHARVERAGHAHVGHREDEMVERIDLHGSPHCGMGGSVPGDGGPGSGARRYSRQEISSPATTSVATNSATPFQPYDA